MEEIHEEIKEAVRQLETYKNRYKTMNTQDVIDMLKRLNENVKLTIPVVGSSAWYCKVENINGQWFEVITGLNETDVAIKIDKAFGKGTRFEIQNEFKLM